MFTVDSSPPFFLSAPLALRGRRYPPPIGSSQVPSTTPACCSSSVVSLLELTFVAPCIIPSVWLLFCLPRGGRELAFFSLTLSRTTFPGAFFIFLPSRNTSIKKKLPIDVWDCVELSRFFSPAPPLSCERDEFHEVGSKSRFFICIKWINAFTGCSTRLEGDRKVCFSVSSERR